MLPLGPSGNFESLAPYRQFSECEKELSSFFLRQFLYGKHAVETGILESHEPLMPEACNALAFTGNR
jgi:hypothetical protein